MAATGATADPRGRLYARLVHRNRLVAVLRWAVPAAGALVLLVVIAGIVIASLSQRFGFSNISIDRDKLVVETPELISTVEDGTVYALGATAAKVSLIQSDIVDLTEATLTATTVEGQVTKASASAAQLQTTDQLISVPGTTVVESTDGLKGTLDMVFLDAMNWTLAAGGKVDMTLPDGTRILADSMTYERNAQHYTFRNVTLELPMTPGEGQ